MLPPTHSIEVSDQDSIIFSNQLELFCALHEVILLLVTGKNKESDNYPGGKLSCSSKTMYLSTAEELGIRGRIEQV